MIEQKEHHGISPLSIQSEPHSQPLLVRIGSLQGEESLCVDYPEQYLHNPYQDVTRVLPGNADWFVEQVALNAVLKF
ncbi:hypothetical protein [Bradyrhizobium tunisiense]|uniref:hypothetical protein n=1 Tax=Bradyrhizobium tunisiense TaxID=3278709 RepID=UPI0035DB41E8